MNDDPDDLDLHLPPAETGMEDTTVLVPAPESGGPGPLVWGALAGVLLLALAGGWFLLRPRVPTKTAASPSPAPAALPSSPSATPKPADLPPLEGSDALVRELGRGLSTNATFTAWLAQTELVRRVAAVVLNVVDGESPRAHLGFFAPKQGFMVLERRGRTVIDPRGYARYDLVGDAIASLDAAAVAGAYQRLEPLFDAAFRELGHPEGGFSKALRSALDRLAAVPVLEGDVSLVRAQKARVLYAYADPKLEALTIPEKHLLRMGPRNVKRIQAKISEVAAALGMTRRTDTTAAAPTSRKP